MKKMEARWRSDMPTAEVVQLLVDIAGATSSDTDEPKLTPKLAPEMEEDNLRNGDCSGSKSMAKDMAVDLYRFSLKNPCTKKTPGCGYRMEYFRSPEDLTRSL